MDDSTRLAHNIVDRLGGITQIKKLNSEPTRLLIQVDQPDLVDWDQLRHTSGIVRIIDQNDQLALVMGPGRPAQVVAAMQKIDGLDESLKKKGMFSWLR
jgi:PTS system sucrose-specific IIC component